MLTGKNKIKCVILAGGLGTRLAEYTNLIPKPLVPIAKKPILLHIIDIYRKFNVNEFLILTGYKGELINKYFKDNKDFTISKKNQNQSTYEDLKNKYQINLINTGKYTKTGLRIKKVQKYLKGEDNFFLTYGDGVSNINLKRLYQFHLKNKSWLTITAVRPPARFGEIFFDGNFVKSFQEKNNINSGWINGGFMVVNSKFFDCLSKKNEMLERNPFKICLKKKKLFAYKHLKFWQCMDNLRDKKLLDALFKKKKAPWT